MEKKTIILINGKARSGKDTLAKMLYKGIQPHTDKNILITHNAQAVKKIAREFFTWDEIKDNKGRQLLIDITNSAYNYDPYFWEKKTINYINTCNSDVAIIPDWRYMSTYEFFKEQGYNVITLHMERVKLNNGLSDTLKNDISEQGFNNFSYDYKIINNNDDLNSLRKVIEDLFIPQLIKRMEL